MSNPWEIQTIEYDKTNAEGNVEVSGYGQISILLNKYVLKEKGKGLSSNDFTDNDKLKLDSVEVGAEKNKLETLTINGGTKIYPNDEKNINLPIPTKVSQLDNDLGYAKLINMSHDDDFSDSYVGKAKFAFQEEESLAIGKNAIANVRGVAIGADTSINEVYDVNINNELLHNIEENIWEGKITEADKAFKNDNGTNLTELDVVIEDLATEIENRKNADETLQNNINTEIQNRINGDNTLQNDINAEIQNRIETDINLTNSLNDEIQNRISEDDLLEINLNTEIQNRTDADINLSNRITHIEDLLPNQASSSNQLADKSFVNSSIQTNTANFRGNWNTWSDVPSDDVDLYPQDYAGNRIPTVNDYLVVQNASDYPSDTLVGEWRFKYTGVWSTNGKNGWMPEYQVNEEPFTSEQLFAINSGITSDKVSLYDSHVTNKDNPHSVTKSQVGLGDVVNSGDSAIPIEGGTTKFTTGGAYTELAKKVDKVEGKGLSTNDFTDTYKNKLDNIDNVVTDGSENIITSGAVFTAISNISSGNVTGVKGEAESTYRSGNVNITKSNLGLTTDEMGIKWSNSNVTSGGYKKPFCANGIWIISSGSDSGIKYSTDGKTWSNSNITSGSYHTPYYANGIWVIGSDSGSGIKYSTDGISWSNSNITSSSYTSPYYANGIWVIGSSGDLGIKYSTDGKTWSDSNITSSNFVTPYYANGIWVINGGNTGYGGGIKYSTDGKTWSHSNVIADYYSTPYYANGIWVISGNSGIKYSTDGKTWTSSNITDDVYTSPYYANGIWIVGNNNGGGIKYSTDGKTWTSSNITSGSYTSPFCANGIWVISGGSSIKYSTDGKTWTSSNITSGSYTSPYYANGIWVISGGSGIKYSTFNSLNDLGSAFKGISELKSYTDKGISEGISELKSYTNDTFATKSYVNNHKLFL